MGLDNCSLPTLHQPIMMIRATIAALALFVLLVQAAPTTEDSIVPEDDASTLVETDSPEDATPDTEAVQADETMTFSIGAYTIQQKANQRYLDAYEVGDHKVVTRKAQKNKSQEWFVSPAPGFPGSYRLRQISTNRYLDAYENSANNYQAVTRTGQKDGSQAWKITYVGGGYFTIKQTKTGRFVDAYTNGNDYKVVTRPAQGDDTQKWKFTNTNPIANSPPPPPPDTRRRRRRRRTPPPPPPPQA